MLQSFIKIFFNIVRYKLPFIAFLIVSFTLATLVYPFIQAHAAGYWRYTYIKRVGNILYQDSIPFRFSGMNIPWLGYDNSKGGEFPSKYRIEDAILTAKEMGATVIRSHTLGISVGCPTCIEPELNKFNGNEAFVSMDYALKFARDNRMRVIIPLTDNWRYFHGGKHTFTTWRGLSNEDEFYSNPQVIQDYKNYISYIVNHVNQFTGTRYKYDPTILAWETGNELDNASGPWNDAWTEEIAKHIKSVAPNHLVADGHISNYSTGRNLTQTQLELPSVDLYSGHFYPLRNDFIKRDAELAKQYNKVYFIGEYDWTDQNTQSAEATIDQDMTTYTEGTASAKVVIKQTNAPYFVQLIQPSLNLTANVPYTISFSAKSSISESIDLLLQSGEAPWTQYVTYSVPVTPEWKTFTYTYKPTQDLANILFIYNLAQNKATVWLDDVKVSSDGATNIIQNGAFEGTTENWLTPWSFKIHEGASKLETFLPLVEDTTLNIAGDLFWQLYGHDDLHGWVGGDRYTFHYPGDNTNMKSKAQLLRDHMYKMSQSTVATPMLPTAPQLQKLTYSSNGVTVDWRGTVGADYYVVERSKNGFQWQQVSGNLTDFSAPWTDTAARQTDMYSYRVTPINPDGRRGKYSNIEPAVGNFLQNNSFDHTGIYWDMSWTFNAASPAAATFTQEPINVAMGTYTGVVNVTQPTPDSIWNVQLRQTGMPLTVDKNYTVSFKAKATDTVLDGKVLVQQYGDPWTVYTQQTFNLSPNWRQYTCTFTQAATDPNTMLAFNLGKYPGKIWFDDVTVKVATGSPTTECDRALMPW